MTEYAHQTPLWDHQFHHSMARPPISRSMSAVLPWYPQMEDWENAPYIESPLEPRYVPLDLSKTECDKILQSIPNQELDPKYCLDTAEPPRHHSDSGSNSKHSGPALDSLLWVKDDPSKPKDKEEMRQIRRHVMNNHINERSKSYHDSRPNNHFESKPTQLQVEDSSIRAKSSKPPASSFVSKSVERPLRTQSEALSGGLHTPNSNKSKRSNPTGSIESRRSKSTKEEPKQDPLVHTPTDRRYSNTRVETVPCKLGGRLNAFDTWPGLIDPSISTEKLKWSCSRYFGSHGITRYWVPALLKARHAFISTICISSAHDDIMRTAGQAPDERRLQKSTERTKVQLEVIALINKALKDPRMQTTDATIIAVLQVLSSEIMGRDRHTLSLHQRGLHDMIRQRGGLENLGVHGQLALVITMNMYLISAFQETPPHDDFVTWAKQHRTTPGTDDDKFPESPIYCKLSGFQMIGNTLPSESPTFELLDTLRLLTNAFVRESATMTPLSPNLPETSLDPDAPTVLALYDKIMATRPAYKQRDTFASIRDKYTFEPLRIVAQVYARALALRLPFSKAAAIGATDAEFGVASVPVRVRNALLQTDLSDCWGHLAGVLFWLVLVAGACANPASDAKAASSQAPGQQWNLAEPETADDELDEEEEARQILSAIAVRCSIVLGFEHGGTMLETLKRFVGIQKALSGADATRTIEPYPSQSEDTQRQYPAHDFGAMLSVQTDSNPTIEQAQAQQPVYGPAEPMYSYLVDEWFSDFVKTSLSQEVG